jgi:hypothetical protein
VLAAEPRRLAVPVRRLANATLPDAAAERVRQDHAAAIHELQGLPLAGALVVTDVSLADGVPTPVGHGLRRPPRWVGVSAIRGASTSGRVDENRDGTGDRGRVVVLEANGYGATIVVDVLVVP